MLPPAPDSAEVANSENVALTCYLCAMLAIAKSMRAVCSRAGLVYGDRLMRLPRRLGFDATPEKLEESRQILEADLADYTEATSDWLDAGSNLAREILAITAELESCTDEGQSLHAVMLEDLADQMAVSAEVETGSEIQASLKRYALGLRSYLQTRRLENRASMKDLQSRADKLAKWLARADPSNSTDLATGLPNRLEIERQLDAVWFTPRPLCALVFEWKTANPATDADPAIARQLADCLADLVRPRDIIGRWSPSRFLVIFECFRTEVLDRAGRIAEWLAGNYPAVIGGAVSTADVAVQVSVIERLPQDTPAQLLQRIEQLNVDEAADAERDQSEPSTALQNS